ncbi:hypothetical protein D3C85_962020 [compost metagenome]
MRPCGSNQQRPLGRNLALHFIQVGIGFAGMEQAIGGIGLDGRVTIEMRDRFQQVIHRNHLQSGGQASLLGIRPRHHQRASGLARREGRRQYPANRPHLTGKCQLSQALHIIEGQRRYLHAGRQDSQGYRQVEPPAILRQISRGEVQRDAPRRKLQP